MARDNIYILSQILVLLRPKTGGFITEILQCRRCCRRCVLSFDLLEFFFVFVGSYIIHLAQFVQLAQSQAGLAQVAQLGLAVVLADVLIGFGAALVDFVEDHDMLFIKDLAHQQVLMTQLHRRLWAGLAWPALNQATRLPLLAVPFLVPWLYRFRARLESLRQNANLVLVW